MIAYYYANRKITKEEFEARSKTYDQCLGRKHNEFGFCFCDKPCTFQGEVWNVDKDGREHTVCNGFK